MKITYTRHGDYYLPDLVLPAEKEMSIGIYGWRHLRYIKEYRKVVYINLLTSGKLNACLADIDRQATERRETLINQMAQAQGITEELKAVDQMAWVGKMNNIRNAAEEIINEELIFA